jgi:BirA family biotin operon repressor/biotin-[acetyl-CoA-carboxylase] ligase
MTEKFHLLHETDSTNNYAMQQVQEGLAQHGMAWLALHQTAGKGQRGKQWESQPGENILLSLAVKPATGFNRFPFAFSAVVALTVRDFVEDLTQTTVSVKWPNDIVVGDRKAGGILIETKYQGSNWLWAVVGVGLNLNQTTFPESAGKPVSIQQLTGKTTDVVEAGKQLHQRLLKALDQTDWQQADRILETYQQHLYKRMQTVMLRQGERVFETQILGVNLQGELLTSDTTQARYRFGELEWL